MTECVCVKCGRRNVFPDGVRPETYGWTEVIWKGWYCFKCEPEGGEE